MMERLCHAMAGITNVDVSLEIKNAKESLQTEEAMARQQEAKDDEDEVARGSNTPRASAGPIRVPK